MGRFYQTSTPTFVDNKMFQLPYELMGKVLEKKDAAIQSDIDSAVTLAAELKAQALKKDEPELQKKIAGYQDRIEEQVQNIKGNVLNYDTAGIQKLKKDISFDWTMGDVSKMEGNRTNYLENVDRIRKDAQAHPDKYLPGQEEALIADILAKYEGYKNLSTGEYVDLKTQEIKGTDPLVEHIKKAMEGTVGKFDEIETDVESGTYRIKVGNKWEGWQPAKLDEIFTDYLNMTPDIGIALAQRESLGMGESQDAIKNAKDYMMKKYQKQRVSHSYTKTLSEEGKSYLKDGNPNEVGFMFENIIVNPHTQDLTQGRLAYNQVIKQKNELAGQILSQAGITGETERKAAYKALREGRFDDPMFQNIVPDGMQKYKKRFQDYNVQKSIQEEVEEDFKNWKKSKGVSPYEKEEKDGVEVLKRDSRGNLIKKKDLVTNFEAYKKDRKLKGSAFETYVASNAETGIDPKTTVALGKEIESLKGLLQLDFQSMGKDLEFSNPSDPNGPKMKLVEAQEDANTPPMPGAVKGEMRGGVQLWTVGETTFAPILTNTGKVPFQDFMNLGLGQEIKTKGTENTDEFSEGYTTSGGATQVVINGKANTLKLNINSARVLDKNIDGQPAYAVPIQGADMAVVATLPVNVLRNKQLQDYAENPILVEERAFADWKIIAPPRARPKRNTKTGTWVGKDEKGWYAKTRSGGELRPGLSNVTEQGLMRDYYDATKEF